MAASQAFLQGLRIWAGEKCGFPVNLGSECLCGHSWAVRLTLGRFGPLGVEGPAPHQGPSRKRVPTKHTCLLLVHVIFLPETGTSKQTEINPNLPLSPMHSVHSTDLWTRRLHTLRQRRSPHRQLPSASLPPQSLLREQPTPMSSSLPACCSTRLSLL